MVNALVGKTVWVTGATGFLGRNFVAKFDRRLGGARAILLLRKEPGSRIAGCDYAIAENGERGFTLDELKRLRDRAPPTLILHFATRFQNGYEPADAEKMVDANLGFPIRMLEACRGLSEVRFLNFGTFYSHADGSADGPSTFYAATKRAFETFLNFYSGAPSWSAITLKCYDTYGPGDDRPKLFPKWVEIARTGERMKVSPGGQRLSFVFVEDMMRAIARAAELLLADSNGHRIYQLPAKENPAELPTLKEIAAEFGRALGKELPLDFGALPYRTSEIMKPELDFPVLPGWRPAVDLASGIRKTLAASGD